MMRAAAEAGANVIAVARNAERLKSTRNALPIEAANRVRIISADLSLQIRDAGIVGPIA